MLIELMLARKQKPARLAGFCHWHKREGRRRFLSVRRTWNRPDTPAIELKREPCLGYAEMAVNRVDDGIRHAVPPLLGRQKLRIVLV